MNKFYVYAYLDPRKPGKWELSNITVDFEPFYVGKGTGRRAKCHLNMKTKHRKNHIISKLLSLDIQPILVMVKENMYQEDALNLESLLITDIGTLSKIPNVKHGPLTNLKLDGTIQIYSEESKSKMSDAAKKRKRPPHSEETKQKIRDAHANRSPEEKKRLAEMASATHKGKAKPPEHSERMSKLHKGKTISEEQKKKTSITLTGREKTPETCEKLSNVQKKTWTIVEEHTENVIVINDLPKWCSDMGVSYTTMYGTLSRNKFHKGYKIVSVSGGTR